MTDAVNLVGLQVGDQLGHLEYVVDKVTQAGYRAFVGSGGYFPNLLADDCRALVLQRCGPLPLTTSWRGLEFLRPPIPGRRVQVGGWLREISDLDTMPRLRVAAFAVDEIGTEIMRSEAVFRVRERPQSLIAGSAPLTNPLVSSGKSPAEYDGLAGVSVGDTLGLGTLVLPEGNTLTRGQQLGNELAGIDLNDSGNDLAPVVVGWLEAGIGRWFGDDFRWGGQMSVRLRRPLNAGEIITGEALVTWRGAGSGAVAWQLRINVLNQRNRPAILGDATVTTPSPRTL